MSAEPPERIARFLMLKAEEVNSMLQKKVWSIFMVSLFVISLAGCGNSTSTTEGASAAGTSPLVSISLTPPNPSFANNTSQQFTATATYANNRTSDVTESVTWISSDETRATIDKPGHVTGKGIGTATIKASAGGISGETTLTVTPATLVSIALTPANPGIAKGTTQQFTATGAFSDNTTQDLTTSVIWSSSNTGASTISNAAGSKGLATAVAAGTTTITAVSGSIFASATLTVTGSSTVTLTWDAPTTRSDGSPLNPLTDLSAYKISYGTLSQSYTQTVTVVNPGVTPVTYTLDLAPGAYYFAVSAIDASGQESTNSNEASKTL
jgi:Bacterial Ig-like domain (group 2)